MSANAKKNDTLPSADPAGPVQDEWGIFDPKQAGMAAAFRTMQGESTAPPNAPNAPENGPAAAPSDAGGHRTPPVGQQPAANGGDAFELPAIDAGLVGRPHAGAMYSVEFPVRCPHCKKSVSTFKVFRLLRAQVSFTSTLPRKGYAIVCPECEGLLSADLSGVL